jgi:DNA-binding MarR family transcriptional regulator
MSTTVEETRTAALEHLGQSLRAMLAAVRRLKGRETHGAPGELSYAQYGLLFGLSEASSGGSGCAARSARELAESAELSAASVTQMLDSLAAHGLVERTRSESDKRVVLSSLTERGRALVDEHRARYEPRWRAALAEFSEADLMTTARVLDHLRAHFAALHDDD